MQNNTSCTNHFKYSCSCTWINIILVDTQRTKLPTSEKSGLAHATICDNANIRRELLSTDYYLPNASNNH